MSERYVWHEKTIYVNFDLIFARVICRRGFFNGYCSSMVVSCGCRDSKKREQTFLALLTLIIEVNNK